MSNLPWESAPHLTNSRFRSKIQERSIKILSLVFEKHSSPRALTRPSSKRKIRMGLTLVTST